MNDQAARRSPAIAATTMLVVALAAATLGAQYQPGDLLIGPGFETSKSHLLLGVTPAGRKYTFTAPIFSTGGMMPSPDNRSLWVSGGSPNHPGGVYDIAPGGALTTIAIGSFHLIGPDGEGGALGAWDSTILRLSGSGAITSVHKIGSGWRAVGMDGRSGDMIFFQSQAALRLKMSGVPVVTTIAVPPANRDWEFLGQMGYDPESDALLTTPTTGRSGGALFLLSVRSGLTTLLAAANTGMFFTPNQIRVHPVQRAAVMCSDTYTPPWYYADHCELVDVRTLTTYRRVWATGQSGYSFDHTAIAGSRHLGALSPAPRGGTFSAMVSFPYEGGARYAVGYSFGMQPGIRVPDGRKIYLSPDPLLQLSLTDPTTFPGGTGTLDANGEAIARMRVPDLPALECQRVFAVAISIAGGQIRTISAPIGVTIR